MLGKRFIHIKLWNNLMTEAIQMAETLFLKGYNCAQAVLTAFASQFGIAEETALRLASPFGGGLARGGHVCGAVSAALMVLGLKYGAVTPEGKEEICRLTRQFLDRFREKGGSILCRDLLGVDLSTPSGLQEVKERNLFRTLCPNLVREAVEILNTF